MNLEVHIDWQGKTEHVGMLYSASRGTGVSFQYATTWLENPASFAIDPTSLPLRSGMQHAPALFGAIQDCGPDRWGKLLIERAVRKKVLETKPYQEIDYVLALDDHSRIGALRFRVEGTSPFLAATEGAIPPLVRLNTLLHATDAIHAEKETVADLRYLLGQGSPVGGARPKSSILLPDGRLAIAKFPKPDDVRDIEAGEILALTLAKKTGIQVAEHQLVTVLQKTVAVISRFDRENHMRIPFLSASTLLGLPAGNTGAYTVLADGIRQFGDDVTGDLKELWRRMVFSLLASNYDDHMWNHGFLMKSPGRWALSPAYDLNPVPEMDRIHTAKTSISEDGQEPSIAEALRVASRFGLKATEAKKLLKEIYDAVSIWREVGRQLHLSTATLDAYESAFNHPLMDEARGLVE